MSANMEVEYVNDKKDISYDRFRTVWSHTQPGLVYPSPHAIFTIAWLKHSKMLQLSQFSRLMLKVRAHIHNQELLKAKHSSVTLGVSFHLWERLTSKQNVPVGMHLHYPASKGHPYDSLVFHDSKTFFTNSKGDLWFHIKSDTEDACQAIFEFLEAELKIIGLEKRVFEKANSRTNEIGNKDGKILGCRFAENLNNPADPISIAKHAIIGPEDQTHFGGSYVIAQRFVIDWDRINNLNETQIEDLIGRNLEQEIIPDRHMFSHIKSGRMQNDDGDTQSILRLGLPFGNARTGDKSALKLSSSLQKINDEQGIFFAGYCNSAVTLENIMLNQIGAADRMLSMMTSTDGGFFYIPSLDDLGVNHLEDAERLFRLPYFRQLALNCGDCDWTKFPAVNWERLTRHYRTASPNGLMYYNHQNYLFQMSTNIGRPEAARNIFKAPSDRILSLLEASFNLWQDNWYFDRKQMEFAGDVAYYAKKYAAKLENSEIKVPEGDAMMSLSIIKRRAWAIRLALNAFSSHDYGFRGRRLLLKTGELVPYNIYFCNSNPRKIVMNDGTKHDYDLKKYEDAKVVCGANTYHIFPEDIIVGGMNNLSLGEGSYIMHYLNDKERAEAYLMNLSEYSGVGHNIPNYEKVVKKGIPGLIQELRDYIHSSTKEKTDFYEASLIAVLGMKDLCLNYAALAREMEKKMSAGQVWEKNNLIKIAERMETLTKRAPATFVEAVQLIFTFHSCLHLTGEPCALGRLDQWLEPFYHTTTADEAQEVIDSLYIKLCDKVQSNRMFMEDHQKFGNLAMNGSSGPYPKGASLNQWIQQVTVGGTRADDDNDVEHSAPAYNEITKIFLKSSGRLPLTAPCLSLRTRKDMPAEIATLAAQVILSGGAHPLFLSDEKIVPGMKESGDGMGGSKATTWMSKEDPTKHLWHSEVTMQSAKNYACDGCYEPQFCGENWFALGGFSVLDPLECALNQGRTYGMAGEGFLYGQNKSYNTKPPSEIASFDELLGLFYEHFDHLNRKAFNDVFRTFGNNSLYCPSPLLNMTIEGCLAKGQDFYSGGPKYNLYGPCYTAIANGINSLYAIQQMCFDSETAVTTLSELVMCLLCNWGDNMSEPFFSVLAGDTRKQGMIDRFRRLREIALKQPRYGRGNAAVDAFGNTVITKIVALAKAAVTHPLPSTEEKMKEFAEKFGQVFPFGFQLQPGSGTFENCVSFGGGSGASADGRKNGETIADDLSPQPSAMDRPVDHQEAVFGTALKGFTGTGTTGMVDGAVTDFNVNESFPVEQLTEAIQLFAGGEGSNIMTITVANPETFEGASRSPSQFDLVRVRMGGWSNFFATIFTGTQNEHKRRPLSTAYDTTTSSTAATTAATGQCPYHHTAAASKKRKVEE